MAESQTNEQMAEKMALLAEYNKVMTAQFELIKKSLPPDVRKAYRVVIKLYELLADPSISDKSVGEAVFEKLPREKIQWALNVLENWKTEDEIQDEARKKERKRRQEKGMHEERKLTEEDNEKLSEFETRRILEAVDALDELRAVLSDQFQGRGSVPRPPELREKLFLLHEKASTLINSDYWHPTDMGLFDLVWEIEDELYEVSEKVEKIQKMIRDLTGLTPTYSD